MTTKTRCQECFNLEDFCTCHTNHQHLWTPGESNPEATAVIIGLEIAATIGGVEEARVIADASNLTDEMIEDLAFAMGDPVAAAEAILTGEEPW